jgi:hypothetical protein
MGEEEHESIRGVEIDLGLFETAHTTTDSNITAGPSLPDCIGPAVINLHYRFKL